VTGPGWLVAVAVAGVVVLAVVVLVDKRRPLRHLDDRPDPPPTDVPGAYLGDGDLDRRVDERITAETRIHRRLQ
jgi:hypothetical protein